MSSTRRGSPYQQQPQLGESALAGEDLQGKAHHQPPAGCGQRSERSAKDRIEHRARPQRAAPIAAPPPTASNTPQASLSSFTARACGATSAARRLSARIGRHDRPQATAARRSARKASVIIGRSPKAAPRHRAAAAHGAERWSRSRRRRWHSAPRQTGRRRDDARGERPSKQSPRPSRRRCAPRCGDALAAARWTRSRLRPHFSTTTARRARGTSDDRDGVALPAQQPRFVEPGRNQSHCGWSRRRWRARAAAHSVSRNWDRRTRRHPPP